MAHTGNEKVDIKNFVDETKSGYSTVIFNPNPFIHVTISEREVLAAKREPESHVVLLEQIL